MIAYVCLNCECNVYNGDPQFEELLCEDCYHSKGDE